MPIGKHLTMRYNLETRLAHLDAESKTEKEQLRRSELMGRANEIRETLKLWETLYKRGPNIKG